MEEIVNQLNSVIVEGNVVSCVSSMLEKKSVSSLEFVMTSNRFYKERQAIRQQINIFKVVAFGSLARGCGEIVKEGTIVRVVGRLESNDKGWVYIVAEHIEAKPVVENK